MAIKYMTLVHIPHYKNKNVEIGRWEYEDTLSSAGNGDTVIIPTNINRITYTLGITSGQGKIQTTTNKLEDVLNDNTVVWTDSDAGSVTANIQEDYPPVTAVRQVNISGTTRFMLIAQ